MSVKAWRELVTIPTYEVGKPDKNPMFLEKRVYQGSSGVVYPYPVIETLSDKKEDKQYHAIWLENEYIKVMLLPELGGRVQMAYDKIKERHFVYYNHVVKPALVGLLGPWISGGIEFNWPQHHRPSTFMPVDAAIVDNEDGSITVWMNEMEQMFHQKGAAGFTLRPGCAFLEIQGRVSNRTPLPQTFLWWANPAVEVNDAYQSVFPPDVNAVFDHGKRAVSSFPIATGTYYKMDYSAGVDISNYKNIKVPTSYMAVNSKYNFEGGYENDTRGGMLHVASHHFSPGKKQWTWGNGDFGRAWDRNLTDPFPPEANGQQAFRPYIELMAGVYTENQPDFAWLMPYEEKQFVQYFMPYRELGIVKQATKDFIFNIEKTPAGLCVKLLATSRQTVRAVLRSKIKTEEYFSQTLALSPEEVFEQTIDVKGANMEDLVFVITRPDAKGAPLMTWTAEDDEIRPIPDAAEAALSPKDTKTNDQLFLTGLHLEQYRHATWSALDYYEEALRRDPDDVRCLNQAGLWFLRRGRFQRAETFLRQAVRILKKRNPNPYDGEPVFNLALALKYQDRRQEAYDLFWKSTWNKAWADAGYFEAACISTAQHRYDNALEELNRCLVFNSCNHKARALKAAVLRLRQEANQKGALQMGTSKELNQRLQLIRESLLLDRFNYGIIYEKYLLTKEKDVLKEMVEMMHGAVGNYHELALDYAQAGLWDEAAQVLTIPAVAKALRKSPMTSYYLGYFQDRSATSESTALAFYQQAEQADSYCCFPNRLEDVCVLNAAKAANPEGAKAPYYLGCLYYAARQYDLAIENWERSATLDADFPTVWRNLALARFNKQNRPLEALEYMEKAFSLDTTDARVLMELDQLYKRMQKPHAERLAFLQKHPRLIQRRDDLVLEEITLLNQTGRYEEAMKKLDAHTFHPWEGGEGKVPAQYQICRVELAKKAIAGKDYDKAIALLNECLEYPRHLGEGKLHGAQENDFYYLLGIAYDAKANEANDNSSPSTAHSSTCTLQLKAKAVECWEQATTGPREPAAAMYYNDAKPEKIFYQGMALLKLHRDGEAHSRFYRLINYGKQHIFEHQVMDYFAVSLPDLLIWETSGEPSELDTKNLIHCKFMLALGHYGMGDKKRAMSYLAEVEALDINHQPAHQFRSLIDMEQAENP